MESFDYGRKWQKFRDRILRRDGYQCQRCKRYGRIRSATEVHHIKHVDEYPELVYDPKNVISLCHSCHNAQHPEKTTVMNRARERTRRAE